MAASSVNHQLQEYCQSREFLITSVAYNPELNGWLKDEIVLISRVLEQC